MIELESTATVYLLRGNVNYTEKEYAPWEEYYSNAIIFILTMFKPTYTESIAEII